MTDRHSLRELSVVLELDCDGDKNARVLSLFLEFGVDDALEEVDAIGGVETCW